MSPLSKFLLILVWALTFASHTVSAQTIKEELSETLSTIKNSEAKSKALAEQRQKLEAEMEALQKAAVEQARRKRGIEREVEESADTLTTLTKEARTKEASLQGAKHNLSRALSGMIALSRMPPEAVVAMPGEYRHNLRTAKALGITSRALHEESEKLQQRLEEVVALQHTIRDQQHNLKQREKALLQEQTTLEKKLAERKKLQSQLAEDQKKLEASVRKLSQKSKNLKDLIESLEKRARDEPPEAIASRKKYKSAPSPNNTVSAIKSSGSRKLRSFAAAKSRIEPPVQGKIIRRFGETKGKNDTSKGLSFLARERATVTATYDGEVVFTGPFLDYGKMVIIKHSDGFHSLLAGLEQVDCAPGQFLLEGEPIGAMGKSEGELYLELRRNNKPVNPAEWMVTRLAKR